MLFSKSNKRDINFNVYDRFNMDALKRYLREPVNSITHGVGAVLSLIALFLLLYRSMRQNSISHVVVFTIFGLSMILLYTASSLYHGVRAHPTTLRRLRKLDHIMIYVLIAGTYTPISFIVLEGSWKWRFLILIWGLAFIGIIKKMFWMHATRWLSTAFYLAISWIGIVIFPILIEKLPLTFMFWFLLGGTFYNIGAVIYIRQKPNPYPELLGFHEIFHLYVLAGTCCHFWAIYHFLPAYG